MITFITTVGKQIEEFYLTLMQHLITCAAALQPIPLLCTAGLPASEVAQDASKIQGQKRKSSWCTQGCSPVPAFLCSSCTLPVYIRANCVLALRECCADEKGTFIILCLFPQRRIACFYEGKKMSSREFPFSLDAIRMQFTLLTFTLLHFFFIAIPNIEALEAISYKYC